MKGLIEWFAGNGVAANLLMALIIFAGLTTVMNVKQEMFPEFSLDMVSVSVLHPGATPEDVEESICVRIEEAIQGVDGVKQITSVATEGVGVVNVEVLPESDVRRVMDDVKTLVDAIDTFPEEAEKPIIQELILRRHVLTIAVSGDADEHTLKHLGERLRDEITALPGITQAELTNARPYEISIEVSEEALRRYELSFDQVARAVAASSLDLPGGSLRTGAGEILLRTKGQAYVGEDFDKIVLLSRPDGTRLLLGDVATVVDGFAETDQFARFDGDPAVMIQVFRVGEQDALRVAAQVKEYLEVARHRVPEGISLTVWDDSSQHLKGRRDLLLRNGMAGGILVLLVLALFLRFKLALWVSLGIPISFLGAMWLMPTLDVSVNMISLFAFIVVLGIVVDDAIVVGENIYTHFRRTGKGFRSAVDGTHEVALPVVFAVLTTVAAFAPLLMVPGTFGKIWRVIPLIVIPTLLFSLIESQLILPNHLTHLRMRDDRKSFFPWSPLWVRFQSRFAKGLETFVDRRYSPSLDWALRHRYLVSAVGIASFLVTAGIVFGGHIKFTFMPYVESDRVTASLTMPQGTPVEVTSQAIARLEAAAQQLREELDAQHAPGAPSIMRHLLASVGDQPSRSEGHGPAGGGDPSASAAHVGEVQIELAPAEIRGMSSGIVARRWRELTGSIPDAVELTFSAELFSAGQAINVRLSSPDIEELRSVTDQLKTRLAEYNGVKDIADSYRLGKREVRLELLPEAEAMGLTRAELARQVRSGFYGAEVQRIQRGRDELKVMVRYPEDERRSLGDLERMRVRMPDGGELPFSAVARANLDRGYASITRVDRQRVISVTADVDKTTANANEVLADVQARVLPDILRSHPGVRYSLEGEQKEQRDSTRGLMRGFLLAIVMIYALMAVPFKSYSHPLVIMSAIPFGLVGAVWGHLLMGWGLSMLSAVGMVALTGVVVNDSLVMVDYTNRRRREGMPMQQAIRVAGVARFRPILLTSLTTFAGLTPMLVEKSLQARFLIPMAISLGFGVIFSTFITLIFVPSSYLIMEDFLRNTKALFRKVFGLQEEEELPAPTMEEGRA